MDTRVTDGHAVRQHYRPYNSTMNKNKLTESITITILLALPRHGRFNSGIASASISLLGTFQVGGGGIKHDFLHRGLGG